MQLHEQIERKRIEFAKAKPRPERRSIVHKDHVRLVVKLLQRGNKRDKRK